MKLFKGAGLDDADAEKAYDALEPYDLVPSGSLDAFKDAVATEARAHPND